MTFIMLVCALEYSMVDCFTDSDVSIEIVLNPILIFFISTVLFSLKSRGSS